MSQLGTTQRLKALVHKLPNPPSNTMQVEWHIQGMGTNMAFKVRRSHPANLVAIQAACNYKKVVNSIRKMHGNTEGHQSRKAKKEEKKKHQYLITKSDFDSTSSLDTSTIDTSKSEESEKEESPYHKS